MSIAINPAHDIFAELHNTFNRDAASLRVDILCAELAAQVAQEQQAVCVGIFGTKEVRKLYGLVWALSGYAVTLRSKRREDGLVMIYAEIELPTPVQFTGSFVKARRALVSEAAAR